MNVVLPLGRGLGMVLCVAAGSLWASAPPAATGRGSDGTPLLNVSTSRNQAIQRKATEMMRRLPLYYERNVGQADPAVKVISRGGGFLSLMTGKDTHLLNIATKRPIDLKFAGAGQPGEPEFEGELPGVSHYYLGRDPEKWRRGVRHYAKVRFPNVYPGIDVVFYSNDDRMEYDFIVRPGGDPNVIKMAWTGVEATAIDESGDLIVTTSVGNIRQKQPVVYQDIGGKRVKVEARYRRESGDTYAVDLVRWDPLFTLVVDPSLQYSTFVGGSMDEEASALTVDPFGSALVGGYTHSTDFPIGGALVNTRSSQADAFVTRLSGEGNELIFTAFLGGEGGDDVRGLAVDAEEEIYATGATGSGSFPTTSNAFQPFFAGGNQDSFVFKLSASGSQLVYCTYFGADGTVESGNGIVVDALGSATIAGTTSGAALVTSVGAIDRTGNGGDDGFVARFSANGRQLVFSTFLGGGAPDSIKGITRDPAGELFVVGTTRSTDFPTTAGVYQRVLSGPADAFVCKLSQNGKKLTFCSLFGGTGTDEGSAIALESGGRIVIAGSATTGTFPTSANAHRKQLNGDSDAFVARLSSDASTLIAGTLLGGGGSEFLGATLSLDGGYMVVGGTTTSLNFPFTQDAFQVSANNNGDGFVTILTPLANTFTFSSTIGGVWTDQVRGLAKDRFNGLYLGGATTSNDIAVVPGSFDTTPNGGIDVFVARIAGVSPAECITSVTATGTTYSADGGGGGVGVGAGCTWNAFTSTPWINFTGSPQVLSTTPGSLSYNVTPNPTASPRTGAIYAAGNLVQILQKGTASVAPYADVPANDIFADYIGIIKANAITSGCTATNFCPAATTTRGQMAVFIVRSLLGTDDFTVRQDPYFADIQSTHPLFKWIQKLRELNITTGCTPVTFCPDNPVTRGEMAVFLVRAKLGDTFTSSPTPYFTDVPVTNVFFRYIQKLRQLGITAGCTATNYCSTSTNTRAQMAVFLTRMFFTPW
jgi:hypothetical protein